MAQSPQFKVYDAHNTYQASTKDLAAAACLVSFYGNGATIRNGHSPKHIVWAEGDEVQSAYESYDFVTITIQTRIAASLPGSRY